jgi:CHAD domain-containing protein
LLRLLKKLQTQLGAYQDIGVQMGHLRELAETLRTQGAPTATLLAVGALLGYLEDQQQQVRDRFSSRFGEFARHGHRVKFRPLFRPAPPALPDAGP